MGEIQEWESLFQSEIRRAVNARLDGKERMARVCARRAVGIVIGEYFQRNKIPQDNPSAYDRLRYIQKLPDISEEVLSIIGHFLARVNAAHSLPIEVDLITEAQQLRTILLKD